MADEMPAKKRLMSLDAFRGFVIISMLIVNNPGTDAAFPDQFRHAPWGKMVTFCDMIFPWFLFIVGVAIPFSAAAFHARTPVFRPYLVKAFKRMLLLVFFGIMIDSTIDKRLVVGMDVLQLIGLAYFCGAMIYELPVKWRGILTALPLLIYWALLRFVPLPRVGAGHFEEGKNIISYINRNLAPYHLAGILSIIPTAALVQLGTFLGDALKDKDSSTSRKLKIMFLGGLIFALAGRLWHYDNPMSKNLWTPSYIIFTAGLGSIVLGLFYILIDILNYRQWAFPFVIYGMNAITAYFFSIMVREHIFKEWFMRTASGQVISLLQAVLNFWRNLTGDYAGAWLYTLSYIFFWWLVLLWMYKKKLFLRV
jgi:predicted acyltransferase